MSNELKDIASKLCPYEFMNDGWVIVNAAKQDDGSWTLVIKPHVVDNEKEAANEND